MRAGATALLLLVLAAAKPAVALEPLVEPVLLRAQRHFEALRSDDCAARLAPVMAFARSPEFDAGLESQERIACACLRA